MQPLPRYSVGSALNIYYLIQSLQPPLETGPFLCFSNWLEVCP